ncbi:hypothetical protein GQ42DRAFT_160666 [Ramicandelaber brevisporus]|nr:hypothetical protein GQ42DRAFT_160666 [Ramicandelaber brevisporus]
MQIQLFSAALILAVALLASAVFSQVPGEWLPSSSDLPFVVALESKGLRTCVGVILTERSVLTNGDCAFNFFGNDEPLNSTSLRILDGVSTFAHNTTGWRYPTAIKGLSKLLPVSMGPAIITVDPPFSLPPSSPRVVLMNATAINDGDEFMTLHWNMTNGFSLDKAIWRLTGNKTVVVSDEICKKAWQLEYMEYTNHKNGFLMCTNVPGPNDNCLETQSPMLLKKIDNSTWAVAGMAATGNCYTLNGTTDFNSVWSQPWFLGKVIAEATGNPSFDNGLDIDSQKASSINGVKIGVPVGMALLFVLIGVFLWVRYKRRQRARAIPQQVELATMSEEPKPTHHHHDPEYFAQYQPRPHPVPAPHVSQVVDEPPPPYSPRFRSN